jgi:hypothetical protein
MLKEFDFFHGVVFTRIIHGSEITICIKSYPTPSNSSYIINDNVGIFIKYSSKRMSPWRFSFQKRHQDEILEMKNKLGEVFTILVCNDDGIVCLSFDELKMILDTQHDEGAWISAARGPREEYEVKGSDGKLKFKIANNDFPTKVLKPYKVQLGVFSW